MPQISAALANFLNMVGNSILIIGAVLVLVGTILAVWTGGVKERFSDERIAANEAETAKANLKAAEANVRTALLEKETAVAKIELEKIKKPRLFSDQEYIELKNLLLNNQVLMATIIAFPESFESLNFAQEISNAFKDVGRYSMIASVMNVPGVPITKGVAVRYTIGNEAGEAIATKLNDFFNKIGIQTTKLGGLSEEMEKTFGKNFDRNYFVYSNIQIIVGDRF